MRFLFFAGFLSLKICFPFYNNYQEPSCCYESEVHFTQVLLKRNTLMHHTFSDVE